MNTDTLTLLGCSSSLALILLATSPAIAAEITTQPADGIDRNITFSQPDRYTSVESSNPKAEISKAIFGCNCLTCQSRVEQMQLNSPNIL